MKALPYFHVDAFADAPFKGNQAAVMPLDEWLSDEAMQAIGAENNFAETAFYVPDETGAADYELRWYTPTHEVALCGHATLASGHVALSHSGSEHMTFRTRKAGILEVRRSESGYELALPVAHVEERAMPELMAALGASGTCYDAVAGVEETTIVLLDDEAAVRALEPDMRALEKIDRMAICTARGSETDIVSRVFVPAWGVPEDSVTGSAHAVLAPFWAEKLGKTQFTAHQASERGGLLDCRMDGERVWLGGPCVTVVQGVFRLPDQA
ncbi:PhzF family phenazine biosynthesis isomerase [Altererythrobacter aurantiacus]|uniref:PhzF family phenazine biosynthesis isomerase n=1 Tax=Parapontixanthobacter aurantiacus TaxID=1463599 RepID=A0A844ZIH1_9SPHN|nr:PhzF family phenazine biosynthesis protein [Parapontixanthobacter aurantiacus]MXO86770.1 PhzF family phenazine biosynthesis isomerase [Parapontixanthobacter aurantiacus]